MTKKLLAVLLSVAMLASIIVVMPVAAATSYADFSNFIDKTWNAISVGNMSSMQYTTGSTATGIGGKASSDKCLGITGSGYLYWQYNYSGGITTIEFNILPTGKNTVILRQEKTNYEIMKIMSNNEGDYGIYRDGHIVGNTMSPNKWYRISVELDFANSKYTVYNNGEYAYETVLDTTKLPATGWSNMNIVTSGAYLDDLKTYTGAYEVPSAVSVTAADNTVTVDDESKTISFEATDVANVASKLSITGGEFAGVVGASAASEQYKTKSTGTIATGDLIAVLNSDGVSYSYYTFESTGAGSIDPEPPVGIDPFNEDFTNFTASVGTGWVQQPGSVNQHLCPGYTATGIGGKSATDKSIYENGNNRYYMFQYPLSGKCTVELNILSGTDGYTLTMHNSGAGELFRIRPYNGKEGIFSNYVVYGDNMIKGQWNRVAVEFDFDNKLYSIYTNGTAALTNIAISNPDAFTNEYRFKADSGTYYMDDLKIYAGAYTAPTKATLTGANINASAKTIALSSSTVTDIESKLNITGGTFAGVVNATDGTTKTSGDIAYGDYIALLADDGVSYSYYTVAEPPKTASFSENFSDFDDSKSASWADQTTNPRQILCSGATITKVAGKSSSDKSIYRNSDSYFYRLFYTFIGKTTLEYSIMRTSKNDFFVGTGGQNLSLRFADQVYDEGNGDKTSVATYELNKWNRVAMVFDFEAGTYDAYLNGEKIVTGVTLKPAAFSENKQMDIYFNGNAYIDDVAIYSGDYKGAALPELTAGEGYTLRGNRIVFDNTVAVSDVASLLGSNVTVVDSTTHLTKTEGNVAEGDLIALVSDDGLVFNYYTVSPDTIVGDIVLMKNNTTDAAEDANLTADDSYKVKVTLTDTNDYMLVIATYTSDGSELVSISPVVNITKGADGYADGTFETAEVIPTEGQIVKAFLWKTDLTPAKKIEKNVVAPSF